MAKKKNTIDFDDDDLILDRKAKRKLARSIKKEKKEKQTQQGTSEKKPEEPAIPTDIMSRVALLCQNMQWREALLLCRSGLDKAKEDQNEDAEFGLSMAMQKIDHSLRRQMVTALIVASKDMLNKEYLLNVG